ncbi:hypothetical protein AB0L06_05775 [Spirillospora sp. NPDC052269]
MVALTAAIAISGLIGSTGAAAAEESPCGPRLATLELPTTAVHSGGVAQGRVRLRCPAGAATRVALASADTSWVSVPASVVVPAGAADAPIPVETHQPGNVIGALGVPITATLDHQSVSRSLPLQPGLKYFKADVPVISGDNVGLQFGLNGSAPEGGTVVRLSSDNPALRMPATVTLDRPSSGASFFGWSTRISQDANVTLTAELPGQRLTVDVALRAWTYDPGDWSITAPPVIRGGTLYGMKLNLPYPVPHGGISITFSSNNPKIGLPSATNLVEGTSGPVNFDISAATTIDADATVTANIEGVGSRSLTLHVLPGLASLGLPWEVTGGQPFEGTVELGTTTSVATTIRLSSDNPAVQVPAEVTVPAGASSVTFSGTTTSVTDLSVATVTAQLEGDSVVQYLIVDPTPAG